MKMQTRSGFTFVETLVVLAVVGLILPALYSIYFVILKEQIKVNRLTEVKRQGDHIVSYLENIIRNSAYKLYDSSNAEICGPSSSPFPAPTARARYFTDEYGNGFAIYPPTANSLTIGITPVVPAPTLSFQSGQLNSSKVNITGFNMYCSKAATYSAPFVNIFFQADFNTASTRPEDNATLFYQTSVKLRNFPTQ